MDRALIVLETDETGRELLAEAGALAAGVDATLVVLSLIHADEYAEKEASLEHAGREEGTAYGDRPVLESARQEAEELVDATLDDPPAFEVVAGRVGERESDADRVLATAEDRDVDHVFLSGQTRSPTGKAVFGDRAQQVLLNFDGPVTTLLE